MKYRATIYKDGQYWTVEICNATIYKNGQYSAVEICKHKAVIMRHIAATWDNALNWACFQLKCLKRWTT